MKTSPTIYAVHEPGLHPLMTDNNVQGWVVTLHELGHDPSNHDGDTWHIHPHTPIARCNHGYGSAGTIPPKHLYDEGSTRFANFVAASPECDWFIVGNEWDHQVEWPDGQRIYPTDYATYFEKCYIKAKSLRPNAMIGLGAVAPWIPWSNWVMDLEEVISLVSDYDFITVHTYTHGHDPSLIISEQMMGAPYQDYHYEFRQYKDQMAVIPENTIVYITETNPGAGSPPQWQNINNGWVKEAYGEIDDWNWAYPTKVIRCLTLYRGTTYDQWEFVTKENVQADWVEAIERGYVWDPQPVDPDKERLLEISREMDALSKEVEGIAERM